VPRFRKISCIWVLGLLCTLLYTTPSFATKQQRPTEAELLSPWFKSHEKFTPEKIEQLVTWAKLDPETDALVYEAMRRFKAKTTREFAKLFIVDEPPQQGNSAVSIARKGGEFIFGDYDVITTPLLMEDIGTSEYILNNEPYRTQIETALAQPGVYLAYADLRSTHLRLYTFKNPSIFLARGESLSQTYESFVHELWHFTHFDLRNEPNPLLYHNAKEFEAAYLLASGQEVEARIIGVRALIRLLHALPNDSSLPVSLKHWFNNDGSSTKTASEMLTVIRDFLGYRFRKTYSNRLELLKSENFLEVRAIEIELGTGSKSRLSLTQKSALEARLKTLEQQTQLANKLLIQETKETH